MIKKILNTVIITLAIGILPIHALDTNNRLDTPAAANNNGNNEPFDGTIVKSVVGAAFLASIVSFSYRVYQEPDGYEFESLESSQDLTEKVSIIMRNGARVLGGPNYEKTLMRFARIFLPLLPPTQKEIEDLKKEIDEKIKNPKRGVYGYLHDLFTKQPDAKTSSDTKSEA